jgi:hypothetical protein
LRAHQSSYLCEAFFFLGIVLFDEKERYPHTIRTPRLIKVFCLIRSMSYDDPARWHGSLKEMLARAGQMKECPAKTSVVPADVLQFAPRKNRAGTPPAGPPDIEIPSFLKRGPRAEEDVMPSGRNSSALRQGA